MALRVPKAQLPTQMSENMIKQLGAVPEPVEVLWHKPEVAQAGLEFGAKVGAWDAADESLKTFAHMAVAAQVGCSWCLDINYFQAQNENLDLAKASEVPRWRDSAGFSCSCVGFRPELGSSGGGGRFVAGLDRFRQTGPTPCKHESLGSLRECSTPGTTAAAAHRAAHARQALSSDGIVIYSDDARPQLLSGFGASSWRRNLALVQSSPEMFAELMPAEADCSGLAPPAGPDLSGPRYRVDSGIVGLLDTLP